VVEVLYSVQDVIKTIRLLNEDYIKRFGVMPLPPYILDRLKDPGRYQTVYARQPGSAAAPTAGLHFTQELLDGLTRQVVELAFLTLHVGLDTFRPVQEEDPSRHRIHTEYYELSQETADVLNRARSEGRRIIAVGTTSVRVLEHTAQEMDLQSREQLDECQGQADLFIMPGHRFRMVDAMVTNFHLPRSTLLMLVSAFANRETILSAYQVAIRERYRFYSFGDAMLIL
ncbi:MAG: tRNA preQ1(34) S-adenosylmethionine ribosyltransferase-isomerase QueA, partial [Dehalococcoidia bacterium]|nr:tRNA preQ1(34) S-adenosylmethionine ribosyltransferase-isomerase QueA [Dehalococcoidia bacterium]